LPPRSCGPPWSSTSIRPARFYDNYLHGYLSRRTKPRLSPVWVVPTRRPEDLRQALNGVHDHAADRSVAGS
jgi:hypothetical protein